MTIRFLSLTEVDNRGQLADMTYPVYQPLLLQTGLDLAPVGVAAFDAEGPCGLGLAFPSEHDEPAHVLSLFVAPSARRQGVGGEVLARLTAQLKEKGEPLVVALYPEGKESTATVERLLVRQGWSTAQPRLHLFHASKKAVAAMAQAHWMRPRSLPSGYTMLDWTEATDADKAVALEHENSPDFPHGVSAFQEPETVNPVTSLGLRENGRLVGWCLTHRVGVHPPGDRRQGFGLPHAYRELPPVDGVECYPDGHESWVWRLGRQPADARFLPPPPRPQLGGPVRDVDRGPRKETGLSDIVFGRLAR
jgi:GNAT superfamily N-acetyltransferase